jgi:hypothetical protein
MSITGPSVGPTFEDPTLAAEVVLLADLLLRILNRRGVDDDS